jgi:hypothetical protein
MVTGPGIGLNEEQSGALIERALELGVNARRPLATSKNAG